MVDTNEILCKIITYYDKTYEIKISKTSSFKTLKEQLVLLDSNLSDIKLIYGGRIIRNDEALISSYTNENIATFYINQSQVHGGCCPKNI
jgi:hypothetical protein